MSSSSSLGGGFSFDTPEAVLQILASVRASDIAANEKNNLRDLILAYTNGGKDPSLKIQIEQTLTSSRITPVASATPAASASAATPVAPRPEFGSSRGVPSFHHAPAAARPAAAPAPEPAKVHVQPAPAPQPVPVPQAPQPVAEPSPAAPANIPVAPAAPAAQPVPDAPVAPQTAPAPSPATAEPDAGAALTRIREIKALVNDKVGNPVNLVDIDNEVGREYMAALLDAMKKLNSGSGSGPAMQRLETAYASVEKVLEQAPTTAAPVAPAVPKPAPTPTSKPKPTSAPAAPTPPPPPPPVPPVAPKAPQPVPKLAPQATKVPVQSVPATPPPKPAPAPVQAAPVAAAPTPPPTPAPQPAAKPATAPVDDARWSNPPSFGDEKPTAPAAPAVATPAAPSPVKSLSESQPPLKSVTDLPARDSLADAGGDPLKTAEVDQGLQQLLSDWTLFKKSGLFGTGPSGVQHPLYQKVSGLQIPLLLAGRFEGATQEIKQSITDYMNGWRYEQGIIYEQGETFDHYLRRVIRHILDLQK